VVDVVADGAGRFVVVSAGSTAGLVVVVLAVGFSGSAVGSSSGGEGSLDSSDDDASDAGTIGAASDVVDRGGASWEPTGSAAVVVVDPGDDSEDDDGARSGVGDADAGSEAPSVSSETGWADSSVADATSTSPLPPHAVAIIAVITTIAAGHTTAISAVAELGYRSLFARFMVPIRPSWRFGSILDDSATRAR